MTFPRAGFRNQTAGRQQKTRPRDGKVGTMLSPFKKQGRQIHPKNSQQKNASRATRNQ